MLGLSQDKEFGRRLGNCSWVDIGNNGKLNEVQYQHSSIGPIRYIAFGLGHELEFTGWEMNQIIDSVARNSPGLTIVYVTSKTDAKQVRGAEVVKAQQLILDLSRGIRPNKKRRYSIRLAKRDGVVVAKATPQDLPECLRIATEFANQRKAGDPRGEISKLFGSRFAELLVAKMGGETVGFVFLLLDQDLGKAYYKHGMWSSQGLRHNAPSLLLYEAILYCMNAGLRYFDFYGVSFADEKYVNIARFKRSFGGELRPYYKIRTIIVMGRRAPFLMKLGARAMALGVWPISKIAIALHSRRSN